MEKTVSLIIFIKQRTLLLFAVFFIISCTYENIKTERDSEGYQSKGVIIGPDMKMCPTPCCSGWDIVIDSINYNFNSIPAGSGIDMENTKFPLAVKLDWHKDNLGCSLIDISRIAIDK